LTCWCHLRPGIPGLLLGLAFFVGLWVFTYSHFKNKELNSFNFEPGGKGTFSPLLEKYLWLSQFVIGLASGSIVLLAGTSIFKSSGKLPWEYTSPIVLLALSVVYGLCFLAFLFRDYESFLHGFEYAAVAYSRNLALGFSSLFSFAIGYLWLAFRPGN
jgi:hypothetical protein